MINYSCKKCGHCISVNENYTGKKVRCPRCRFIMAVPEHSTIIVFQCENCGQKIKASNSVTGENVVCPNCKNASIVPYDEDFETLDEPVSKDDTKKIILITVVAAVVVAFTVLFGIFAAHGKKESLKSQNLQNQQQIRDTITTEQSARWSKKTKRSINKWQDGLSGWQKLTILIGILLPIYILVVCYTHWCPNCRKMWATKRITPLIQFSGLHRYQCKYCGNIKSISSS